MRLSYDNLLLHLAHDYNNVLLHHTTSRSNYSNRYHSYSVERKKRKRQEEGKEDELCVFQKDEVSWTKRIKKNK